VFHSGDLLVRIIASALTFFSGLLISVAVKLACDNRFDNLTRSSSAFCVVYDWLPYVIKLIRHEPVLLFLLLSFQKPLFKTLKDVFDFFF
jgi:hypothetical protein